MGGLAISTGLRRYFISWMVAAIAIFSYLFYDLVSSDDLDLGKLSLEFALFLGLYVAAEAKPVDLPRLFLTVASLVTVIAIIQMPPAAVALMSGLGVIGIRIAYRSIPLRKLVFNSAQLSIAGGLAAQTYRLLGGGSEITAQLLPQLVLAIGAATLVFFAVNSWAVSAWIAIETGSRLLRTWRSSFGWTSGTYIAFGALGIVLSALYQAIGVLALPLLFVPFFVARAAFHSYQEVSEAYDATVRAFVAAIDAKDSYTRGHSERVADYSKMIAERLGMRERDLEVFYYGALLHDVGKLVVTKKILTKPSALDEDEWTEIKRHPVIGAEIVKEIEFLEPALDAVLSHHERLNGSGYPAGLARDLVPMNARIMAVADTYDAMTSSRAYRGARTHQEAIEELTRCVGTLFDEQCVREFIAAFEERASTRPSLAYEAKAIASTAG